MMKVSAKALFKESDFSANTIVAAVSGGSDSLALLLLLHDYLASRPHSPRLVAVTVDHQLRPESAAEAQWVGDLCKRHNIAHETMRWMGDKPLRALSEEARIARYNLLCEAAAQLGGRTIFTGHTLDDQVETYEMRSMRQSTRGLAAMPREAQLKGEFCLVRPLLTCRRQQLRDYLHEKGLDWVNDPSNENEAYERVRIRKNLNEKTIEEAQRNIAEAREARRRQARIVAGLIQKLKPVLNGEILEIAPFPPQMQGQEEIGFTFGVLAAIMGGAPFLPPDRQVEQLKIFCNEQAEKLDRATLVGALIEKSPKGWRLWRENRSLMTKEIKPGETIIWDGRFRIENSSPFQLQVGPAQLPFLKELAVHMGLDNEALHFPSLQVSPVIRTQTQFDVPVLSGAMERIANVAVSRIMGPFDWLISGDDFAMTDMLAPIFRVNYYKK